MDAIDVLFAAIAAVSLYFTIGSGWGADIGSIYRDKYKRLYGTYRMFNISRRDPGKLVQWTVRIKRRFALLPRVELLWDEGPGTSRRYTGLVRIAGDKMIFVTRERMTDGEDFAALVFMVPEKGITASPGYMCSFAHEPVLPYAGLHLLTDSGWTKDDVRAVFESGLPVDLNYSQHDKLASNAIAAKKAPLGASQ